jgi:hypothetical protein
LATRAVYSFTGFPGAPVRHLYLHHDGYPTGAAWRFATALRQQQEMAAFLAAFLSTQPGAEPLAAPEQAADADYRYQVQLLAGDVSGDVGGDVGGDAACDPAGTQVQVQCWRRLRGSTSWQPRCRPMPLAQFIRRFLPGDPL